jgi:hypothetical protein
LKPVPGIDDPKTETESADLMKVDRKALEANVGKRVPGYIGFSHWKQCRLSGWFLPHSLQPNHTVTKYRLGTRNTPLIQVGLRTAI